MDNEHRHIVDITWISAFGVFGLGVIAGGILCFFHVSQITLEGGTIKGINMQYADLAAILLAAVSVIVTALGVGIAIITFIGYRQIKKAATEVAKAAALIEAQKQFTLDPRTGRLPNQQLQDHINQAIETSANKIAMKMNVNGGRSRIYGDEGSEYGDGT